MLSNEFDTYTDTWSAKEAAAELRRQHAENETLRTGYDAARLEIASLHTQMEAVGAGGVEPLRKRECLHKISEFAQLVDQVQDAVRYQFLRDGEWRDIELEPFIRLQLNTELEPFIRLQLNTMRDAKIDAAISSLQGGANG